MGTPTFASSILLEFLQDKTFEVKAVFTQPAKKQGRSQKLIDTPCAQVANEYKIPCFTPQSLSTSYETLKTIAPDFIIVAAYAQILTSDILDLAPCINLHASVLPKYRGASPIQSCLLGGEKTTGVTAMLMNEGLDTGDILAYSFTQTKSKTSASLFDELALLSKPLIIKTLKNFPRLVAQTQHDCDSSMTRKIRKNHGMVDFSDAKLLVRKFHALYPWPGIFLQSSLKLLDLSLVDTQSNEDTGRITKITHDGVHVACKNAQVCIKTIQPPSKKPMSATSYINGKRLKLGDYFS